MGVTNMTAKEIHTEIMNHPVQISDKACEALALEGADPVYAGSGWTDVRGQNVSNPAPGQGVEQYVVLFSSAHDAAAFFTASAQTWVACSNRQLAVTSPGRPDRVLNIGPVANMRNILSADTQLEVSPPPGAQGPFVVRCQRALTVANNVIIDVWVGGLRQESSESSNFAVIIANQIAAKVPT